MCSTGSPPTVGQIGTGGRGFKGTREPTCLDSNRQDFSYVGIGSMAIPKPGRP